MTDTKSPDPRRTIWQRYYRPPFIGVIAFFAVLLALPVAHSFVIVVRDLIGYENAGGLFLGVGAVAAVLLLVGTKRNEEVSGTLLGFAAGMLIWIGWASYAFKFNEITLHLPMPEVAPGVKWPAHLLYIQGSIGICVATLLFFVFNKNSRCNAFRWIQKTGRLNPGDREPGRGACVAESSDGTSYLKYRIKNTQTPLFGIFMRVIHRFFHLKGDTASCGARSEGAMSAVLRSWKHSM